MSEASARKVGSGFQHLGAVADGRLLLADHPMSLLNEAHADGHRDPVRRWLIDIECMAEQLWSP